MFFHSDDNTFTASKAVAPFWLLNLFDVHELW